MIDGPFRMILPSNQGQDTGEHRTTVTEVRSTPGVDAKPGLWVMVFLLDPGKKRTTQKRKGEVSQPDQATRG